MPGLLWNLVSGSTAIQSWWERQRVRAQDTLWCVECLLGAASVPVCWGPLAAAAFGEVSCDFIGFSFARERFQFGLGRHCISFTDVLRMTVHSCSQMGSLGCYCPSHSVLLSKSAAGVLDEFQTPCGGRGVEIVLLVTFEIQLTCRLFPFCQFLINYWLQMS